MLNRMSRSQPKLVRIAAVLAVLLAVFALSAEAATARGRQGKSEVIVRDRFAGPPSALESHSPAADRKGGGWQVAAGQWQIERRRVEEVTGQDTPYRAVIDPNAVNVELSAAVTWPGSAEVGLVFRYEDAQNWFGYLFDGRHLKLVKSVGGELTTMKRRSVRWKPDDAHVMSVTVDGEQITAALDGKRRLSLSDRDLQGNRKVGFYYTRETKTWFREFEVKALGPEVEPGTLAFPDAGDAVLFDSFDGSGALADHMPDTAPAGGWTMASGVWQVSDGEASETTGFNVDNRAFIDSGLTDIDLYVDVAWHGGRAGVVYRYADELNWYMSWTDGSYVLTGKLVGGEFNLLRILPFDWGPAGTSRTMRVRINGDSIRVYVDEDLPLSLVVDPDLGSNTSVGLFSRGDAASSFSRLGVAVPPPLPGPDILPPPDPPPVKPPAPPAPPGVTVYDSFSEFPWTPLVFSDLDQAPPFRTWDVESGAWATVVLGDPETGEPTGMLTEGSGAFSDQRAVINSGVDESVVSARIRWDQGRAGVVFRYRNEQNWFMFWYDGDGLLVVGKAVAGIYRPVASIPFEWKKGRTRTLSVEVQDDEARAYVGKKEVAEFSVEDVPAGVFAGMFVRNVTPVAFDDVTVVALANQPPPGGGQVTPIIEDTFGESGVRLGDHVPDLSPDGSTWVEASGLWAVDDGEARETTGGNSDHRAVVGGASADLEVRAGVTWRAALAGLTFRWADEWNWYLFFYDGVNVVLGKVVEGIWTPVVIRPLDWGVPGTTREVKVRVTGDAITAFIDGTDVISVVGEADLQGASHAGVFSRGSAANSFDDFSLGAIVQ